MLKRFDVVVIGAGASGLMCAAQAGARQKRVLVLDHGSVPGRKILMSGGGRCNFTNLQVTAENYICKNPHFCKSAISQYTPWDFLDLMAQYKIAHEERSHGQLFCRKSASQILDMLLSECQKAHVKISLNTRLNNIEKSDKNSDEPGCFRLITESGIIPTDSLVIATGGVSIPSAGASPFGYRIAEQFGIPVVPPRPGLVPFTLQVKDRKQIQSLSGISVESTLRCRSVEFTENLLFTHRGLSGPVVLQISSYWKPGQTICINLIPGKDVFEILKEQQLIRPQKQVRSIMHELLPKRLVEMRLADLPVNQPIGSVSHDLLKQISVAFHQWLITPGGTEGNRTAEVTVGGVDCNYISSKTMEARTVPGLFFIGEVLDVTGWLGGYNLQWAWSSGYCAGQYV